MERYAEIVALTPLLLEIGKFPETFIKKRHTKWDCGFVSKSWLLVILSSPLPTFMSEKGR